MNRLGQEEAGFRLLIEIVMVAFIMVIIYSVITQVDSLKDEISKKSLFDGFQRALDSPDGSIIVQKDLVFSKGASYSNRAFAGSVAGIGFECIEIQANESIAFKLYENHVVEITTQIQTDVYYKCLPGEGDCKYHCTVSFGKDLAEEE
ncbi:MAG: hypothetical protein WC634_03715 [archaeon]